MNRRNAAVIAAFLALALVAGLFAAVRTSSLGASASVPAVDVAAANRKLDRYEASLARQARSRPPALPAAAPAAAPGRVVYVRPSPLVRTVSRHGEDEGEHADGGHEHDGQHHDGHDDDD